MLGALDLAPGGLDLLIAWIEARAAGNIRAKVAGEVAALLVLVGGARVYAPIRRLLASPVLVRLLARRRRNHIYRRFLVEDLGRLLALFRLALTRGRRVHSETGR